MTVRHSADVSAFSEFVTARSGSLLSTAYLVLGDHQLAQDLVQEALVKTYVAWPRIRDHGKAEAYARRTVVNTAISWRRRRSFHERPTDAPREIQGPDQTEIFAAQDEMWSQLQSLPPRMRAAVVLRYYQDLSEAQTAELMGCSVGSVKRQVSTGLTRLRDRMGTQPATRADEEAVTP